ncbi:MAG: aminopeptidase [Clostridia bacterium]|nr:aminopeptidase [Clostridia bacterium]MBQ9880248.1 aminopeptidase [Clostridia bacterium]
MSKEDPAVEQLKKDLFYEAKHASDLMSDDELRAADEFCEGYKAFLNKARTERECAAEAIRLAEENGFTEFDPDQSYFPGDKIWYCERGKAVILCVIGRLKCTEGVRIAAAHIDSPRLDLKPNPLYESSDIGYFKTHYYGGIKKYQWTCIPLSLHGVVVRSDGAEITVSIGDEPDEPKFVISDLLPHLAASQMKRTLSEGVKGEELNIIIGSRKYSGYDGKDAVKLAVMSILNEKYGITEKDFVSAELEAVPAFKADDIGFDRSLIGAYGHDDRVDAYPELIAALDVEMPEKTVVAVLTDKEEIGSEGNTGLQGAYLKYFIWDLARTDGLDGFDVLAMSECLSADVNAAYDPTFPEVFDKQNSSYLNRGVTVTKYTGSRGKSSSNDASAEFVGKVTRLFDSKSVCWQTGELGKVDEGGGGTVAKYIADLGADVVDIGVPVLSMHSPYELVAKSDIYSAYRAIYEFFMQQ